MHETLTTAALLLVPSSPSWSWAPWRSRSTTRSSGRGWLVARPAGSVAPMAEARHRVAPRGSGSRGVRPVLARSGAVARRRDRRSPVVLVR